MTARCARGSACGCARPSRTARCRAPCQRVKLTPQASRDGSKDSVLSGMARFRGPALAVAARGGVPDALPVPVLAIRVGVDRFAAHAIRVDVEHVAAPALVVGIERDRETVLAEGDVALVQDLGDDLVRVSSPRSARRNTGCRRRRRRRRANAGPARRIRPRRRCAGLRRTQPPARRRRRAGRRAPAHAACAAPKSTLRGGTSSSAAIAAAGRQSMAHRMTGAFTSAAIWLLNRRHGASWWSKLSTRASRQCPLSSFHTCMNCEVSVRRSGSPCFTA